MRVAPTSHALARLLRPSGGSVALTGLLLGWRALAWQARLAWRQPDATTRGAVLGIAADLALSVALVALLRAVRDAVSPRTRREFRVATTVLGGGIVAASLLVRALDAGHCYLAGAHFSATGFAHLDPSYVGLLAEGPALWASGALVLSVAAAALALGWELRRRARRDEAPRAPTTSPPRVLAAAVVIACAPALGFVVDSVLRPPDPHALRLIPEVNFARAWFAFARSDEATGLPVAPLLPRVRARLAAADLIPDPPLDPRYPLLRQSGEPTPLPFAARAVGTPGPPNVVLTLLEAVNHELVSALSGRFEGLMPQASALATQMTRVDGYLGTTSPTILALVSILCALHCPLPPGDLHQGRGQRAQDETAYTCLAEVLRRHGYRTVFVQGAKKGFARKGHFLSAHGFDEVHAREELHARFPDRPTSRWGAYDQDLVAYTQEQIARLERQRSEDGRPYLLVMLTLDAHQPGMSPPGAELPANIPGVPDDAGARRLLLGYHTSDDALGELGRFMLQAPRADDTLWVVTADHVQFAIPAARAIFGDHYAGNFGPLPLLLHDPRHDLPAVLEVLSGTTDLAPTLLHLLGIPDHRTSMTGASIFARRRERPWVVGRVADQSLFVASPLGAQALSFGEARRRCDADASATFAGHALGPCDLLAWARWQDDLWSSRHLLPPDLAPWPQPFVAHAGGALPGTYDAKTPKALTYSNSLEALDHQYARGHRLFELDLHWTSDGHLVLVHDWAGYFAQHHPGKAAPGRMTRAEFLAYPFGFTPLDLEGLAAWLERHRDAFVITDLKERNLDALGRIARERPELARRLVPQIYDLAQYEPVRALGFEAIVLTLYQMPAVPDAEILAFAARHHLFAVTMPIARAHTDLAPALRRLGRVVYAHTVNDPNQLLALWQAERIDGVYTDSLDPRTMLPARVHYERPDVP